MRHAALPPTSVPSTRLSIEPQPDAPEHRLSLHASDLRPIGTDRHIVEKHDIGRAWQPLRGGDRFEQSIRFAGGGAVRPSGDTEVTLNLEFAGGRDRRVLYHAHYALFLVDTAGNPIGCYRDSGFDVSRDLTITSRRICGLSDSPDIGGIDLHVSFDELCGCEDDGPVAIRLGMVAFGPVAGIVASATHARPPATNRIRARRPTLRTRRRGTVAASDISLSA